MSWSVLRPNPDVVASDLLDGGVLFDLNSKQYYQLNPAGFLVWRTLESGGELSELESRWSGEAAGPSESDPSGLREFVSALSTFGLVAEGGVEPTSGGSSQLVSKLPPETLPPAPPRIEPHGSPLSQVILSPFDPTVPIPE